MTEETTRQQKVGRLVQKEIGSLFLREASTMVYGAMVTVTKVRVSPDLSSAKVYLSVFPFEKNNYIMDRVKAGSGQLRLLLGRSVKTQLRIVPTLSFYLDDSIEYIERIDSLLK